jgi:DNA-directed RNA polymerase specialized sigma subunit
MVASTIQLIKSIRNKFVDKHRAILKQYSYDPEDQLLGRGMSTVPKAMELYRISSGTLFSKYLGHSVWREMYRDLIENRGITRIGDNDQKARENPEFQKTIMALLYPQRFYFEETGEDKPIPDFKVPVEEAVNYNLVMRTLRGILMGPTLSDDDKRLLVRYYWEELTLEEIGQLTEGITREAVRLRKATIEKRLLRSIKSKYGMDISLGALL